MPQTDKPGPGSQGGAGSSGRGTHDLRTAPSLEPTSTWGGDSLPGVIVVRIKLNIWNPQGRVPGTRQVQNVAMAIQDQGVFSEGLEGLEGLEGQGWAASGPSRGQP